MAKLFISDDWWTAPAEGEGGRLILVTGRRAMNNVIATGLYRYRVEVTWSYTEDDKGLPQYADSKVICWRLLNEAQRGTGTLPRTAPAIRGRGRPRMAGVSRDVPVRSLRRRRLIQKAVISGLS